MEYIDRLIGKYKNVRSVRRLSESFLNEYAFVGVGSHSVDNLYPVWITWACRLSTSAADQKKRRR